VLTDELNKLGFSRVIACDTEYNFGVDVEGEPLDGNPLRPVCVCAKDLISNESWEIWLGEFPDRPPFPLDETTLFIAFNASAEVRTFMALGWPAPARILDLFAEFCDHRNGRDGETSRSLLSALTHFGLDSIGAVFKKQMIDRILKGGPFTAEERCEILDYCWSDVYALERLLAAMLPDIAWKGALVRGRYANAVAAMESAGIPVNVGLLNEVVSRWSEIQGGLIRQIDLDYGVYDGTTFKKDRFESYVDRHGIPWTRLKIRGNEKIGALALDADTFADMARIFPAVAPLAELRGAIGKMRRNDVPVGEDGRARTGIRPFASSTSRNQPSTSEFLYGASKWIRNFIQPEPGHALIYFDYSAEEVGIAAALSGDMTMQADYINGDFYINFGIALGQLPRGCTKAIAEEHRPGVRDRLKVAGLATLYGMGPALMAMRIEKPRAIAAAWVRHHHHRYRVFWEFIQRAVDHVMRNGSLETELGWHLHPRRDPNPRSLANFPIQANAAEILRVACCLATEAGFEICAPVHDAVLVNCRIEDLDRTTAEVRALMVRASQIVLGGFSLKVGVETTQYPDHLADKRGVKMWAAVMEQMDLLKKNKDTA
jgi:DNA polymerase family A